MNETTTPLDLGSDLALRYRYFTRESLAQPAKLHLGLLAHLIERYTAPGDTIADPMAGIGSTAYAALLQRNVILREIEPAWLKHAHTNAARIIESAGLFAGTIAIGQADAREPWNFQADHLIFSPPYGCSVASTPTAKGMTSHQIRARLDKLGSYDRAWDRLLRAYDHGATGVTAAYVMHYGRHPAQLGHLRGDHYWQAMEQVYCQALAALRPGGRMILVIKDHIRRGQRVTVAADTARLCAGQPKPTSRAARRSPRRCAASTASPRPGQTSRRLATRSRGCAPLATPSSARACSGGCASRAANRPSWVTMN